MTNMQRNLRTAVALALAAAGYLGAAQAAPVVSITPASQDLVPINGTAIVDIIVSGLTQPGDAVGGFWITLDFDDLLLDITSFAVDPDAAMGAYDVNNDFSFGDLGGTLDLFYIADQFLSQAALGLLQDDSFRLATVSFTGLANGLSPLTLTNVELSNFDGTGLLNTTSTDGSICVGGNCGNNVPEPASYGLAAIALLAAGAATRRRRSQTAA